ncbi:MAG: hypothetical protein II457_04465 [Paludibacteraceae bacterium]|nr:hypothetical protein [Paludibacteraceae bacterium]
MKRYFSVLISIFFTGLLCAQEADVRPQRTPEEEAVKQTTRLTRELGITDSSRIDTIYRMHLKYARIRQKGLSRAENMERMQAIYGELKLLLTPDEFDRFMNHPAEQPRRPRGASMQQRPAAAPSGEAPDKPNQR